MIEEIFRTGVDIIGMVIGWGIVMGVGLLLLFLVFLPLVWVWRDLRDWF